jgi:hypothetical protein
MEFAWEFFGGGLFVRLVSGFLDQARRGQIDAELGAMPARHTSPRDRDTAHVNCCEVKGLGHAIDVDLTVADEQNALGSRSIAGDAAGADARLHDSAAITP